MCRAEPASAAAERRRAPPRIPEVTRVALCTRVAPGRIVAEATGGLVRPLVDARRAARLPVAVASPDPVRHFAKALGARQDPPR